MNAKQLLNTTWNYAKSAINGGSSRQKMQEALVSTDPTAGYHHNKFYDSNTIVNNLPLYTTWAGRLMLNSDPVVEFSLNVRNAALMVAEVEIKAKNDRVQKWLDAQWNTLWELNRDKILSAKKWGFAGLQPTYKFNPTTQLLDIDGLKDFAPEDVKALESNGKQCGFRVRDRKLFGPRSLWMTFNTEYDSPYGRGTLRRSYPPWYEKWMDRGAKKLIQQRMIKDAYVGDIFWTPFNLNVELPNGDVIPWRDLARQIAENRMSGGAMVLPMMRDDKGNQMMDYKPPQGIAGGTDIFTWLEKLDEDILRGADIPIEVIKASETGSGFSGRSIPFMVLLSVCTGEFVDYVKQVQELLRMVAWLNFGGDPEFEMKPKSLVESFAGDASGSPMGGGAIGGQPGQGPQQLGGMQSGQFGGQGGMRQPPPTRFDLSGDTSTLDEITAIGTASARRRILTAAEQIRSLLAQKKTTDLAGEGSLAAETFEGLGKFSLLADIRLIIESLHRGISSDLQSSMLAANFAGAAEVAVGIPPAHVPPTSPDSPPPPTPPVPPTLASFFPDEPTPGLRFPVIDDAIQVLHSADVFTSDDYREVAEQAKAGAFAITSTLGEEAVSDIRDLLQENLAKGPDMEAFVEAVQERLQEGGPLSERHIETIFRTNVSSAFSNGANKSLESPMVADAFPYRMYWATTDQRVRHDHIALEKLGLQGTNIYRADDPTWFKFRPPWDFNCRCSWNPVTVEQAARKGITEAIDWLARAKEAAKVNGGEWPEWLNRVAPTTRDWVTPPPFEPSPEFVRK